MSQTIDSDVVVKQKLENSLYMHWEYDQEKLQELLPEELELDTFQNKAYISVIVHRSSDCQLKYIPFNLPSDITAQNKVSIRTYVKYQGQRGVYYINCHSNNSLANFVANKFFNFPSNNTKINFEQEKNKFTYKAKVFNLEFKVNKTKNKPQEVKKNTINYFVLNRDWIFTTDSQGSIIQRQVEQKPLEFQECSVLDLSVDNLLQESNLTIENNPPKRIHYINELEKDLLKVQ